MASDHNSFVLVEEPRLISIPALNEGAPVTLEFNVMILSLTVKFSVFAYTVAPVIVKFPVTTVSPVIVPPEDENFVLAVLKAACAKTLAELALSKAACVWVSALVILVFCVTSIPANKELKFAKSVATVLAFAKAELAY